MGRVFSQFLGPRWNSANVWVTIVGNCLANALASPAGSAELFASTAKHVYANALSSLSKFSLLLGLPLNPSSSSNSSAAFGQMTGVR